MITGIIEHVSLNYNALFQSVKKNAKLLILNLKFNHYYSLLAKNFRTNELSEHEGHTSLWYKHLIGITLNLVIEYCI